MTEGMKYGGVLLAGGASRRYGSPKAFAKLRGRMFYQYSYDILVETCEQVVVVTNDQLIDKFPQNLTVVTDLPRVKGLGPLAGIYSAMNAIKAENYFVLPCDMPLLTKEIVEKLKQCHTTDVTIVQVEGRLQPLVSLWNEGMKEQISIALAQKRLKMTSVLEDHDVTIVEAETLTDNIERFMNINTVKEREEASKWRI